MTAPEVRRAPPGLMWQSVLASWWSLPVGLAEATRIGVSSARLNSLFSEDLSLRPVAGGAAVVLFYALAFFLLALAAGLAGGLAERAGLFRRERAVDAAVAAGLFAGAFFLMDPLFAGPNDTARLLVGMGALIAAGLGARIATASRKDSRDRPLIVPALFAGALALFGLPLYALGMLPPWPGLPLWAAAVAILSTATALLRDRPVAAPAFLGAAVVVLAGLVLAGANLPDVAPRPDGVFANPNAPPVVLITVDTLRADALRVPTSEETGEAAPPEPPLMPHLATLAGDGITFPRAWAPSPWTIPSAWSMLTSRHPHEIGMTGPAAGLRLSDDVPRLPGLLPESYEVRGVMTNYFGVSIWGSWLGFDQVESADVFAVPAHALTRGLVPVRALLGKRPLRYRITEARGGDITDRAIRHIDAMKGGPFFLWVHYFDPHMPYIPDPPFDEAVRAYDGRLRAVERRSRPVLWAGTKLDAADRAFLRSLYEAEVRSIDVRIGRLRDALRERGLWDGALVVFTSDHGEELWERGSIEHGHSLHDELLRVPLVVKLPGNEGAGTVVDRPVSLLDVTPTVLDALGVQPADEVPLRGRSLVPLIRGEPVEDDPPLLFEGVLHFRELKGRLEWPWKLVYSPIDGKTRLYDLAGDPAETVDRSAAEPERVAAMMEALRAFMEAERTGVGAGPEDESLEGQLKALGYIQ